MAVHDHIGEELAAYLTGRLGDETRIRIDDHVATCRVCAALVADLRPVAAGVRAGGERIFEGHPSAWEIRTYALGEPAKRPEAVGRHLALCASCSLEASVASAAVRRSESARTLPSVWSRWAMPSAALAAGIVLGLMLRHPVPVNSWRGPVDLPVLPGPTRGEHADTTIHVASGQSAIVIAMPFVMPDGVAARDRLRLDIVAEGGRVLNVAHADRGDLESRCDATGVLPLMVPAGDLPPGRYTLRLHRESPPEGDLMDLPFRVVLEAR
jgi:anti-sigma factor RsiW